MSYDPPTPQHGVVIYGASDDLIEIDGTIREEWNVYNTGVDVDVLSYLIGISDGTLARIGLDNNCWRITLITSGTGNPALRQCPGVDENDYSDHLTITGDVRWVTLGTVAATRKGPVTP